jgi:hypothetical protein
VPPAPPATEITSVADEEYDQVRQQRINDSFNIYKKQQEDLKKGIMPAKYVPVNTWSSAPAGNKETQATSSNHPVPAAEDDAKVPIFWTEVMDLQLAKQVQQQLFDFDAITREMQTAASEKSLNSERVHRSPHLLTVEVCRRRWMELDAQHWCELAPGVSAADTLFRINVSDEVLATGYQPSYDELMQIAARSKPKYLNTPTVLPVMPSYANDSEEEKDEDDEDEDGTVRIFKVSDVTMAAAALVTQRSTQIALRAQLPAMNDSTEEEVNEAKSAPVFEMGLD